MVKVNNWLEIIEDFDFGMNEVKQIKEKFPEASEHEKEIQQGLLEIEKR